METARKNAIEPNQTDGYSGADGGGKHVSAKLQVEKKGRKGEKGEEKKKEGKRGREGGRERGERVWGGGGGKKNRQRKEGERAEVAHM